LGAVENELIEQNEAEETAEENAEEGDGENKE